MQIYQTEEKPKQNSLGENEIKGREEATATLEKKSSEGRGRGRAPPASFLFRVLDSQGGSLICFGKIARDL